MVSHEVKDPAEWEKTYVHDVYNTIYLDFDKTRTPHWTAVKAHINQLPKDILIGDIGCGNGKNMLLRPKQFEGCDICQQFVDICKSKQLNAKLGDVLNLPFNNNSFLIIFV